MAIGLIGPSSESRSEIAAVACVPVEAMSASSVVKRWASVWAVPTTAALASVLVGLAASVSHELQNLSSSVPRSLVLPEARSDCTTSSRFAETSDWPEAMFWARN